MGRSARQRALTPAAVARRRRAVASRSASLELRSPGATEMADGETVLTPFSLTQIHYNPLDQVSLLCAWLALVPQALCVVYVTLIFATREAEMAMMFAGQLWCEAVNFGLKRLFKEQRPARFLGRGYGMPSSHAQFVTFWAVSAALILLVRHQSPVTPRVLQRAATSVGLLALAAAVAWSRVYLGYHTPRQVFVGAVAGALCALFWFALVASARRSGLIDWALDLYPARYLRIRDLLTIEDPWEAGWDRFEKRRQTARLHKQS